MADNGGRDFFISYTGVNRPWAEWIAVQLEAAGYTTLLQAWDFHPGKDFIHEMQQGTTTAGRTIAVLSPAYLGSKFGEAEWRAAFHQDPTGEAGLLVPVRVQPCKPPGLLASRVYIDLVDTDEATARRLLLDGVGKVGARPTTAPFPGAARGARRFPGQGPEVSNLPARNRNFTARGKLLEDLHASLQAGSAAVPMKAIYGLGGVGKTQLALEYAHRFGSDYEVVWWIPAEHAPIVRAALAGLARQLGVEQRADQVKMVAELFEDLRGRDRWLLVYDNAEGQQELDGLLPRGGRGHVLITSRNPAWGRVAAPLRLGVLPREDAVAFLRERTGAEDVQAAAAVAEALGDLPLALEEAAAYIEETRLDLNDYLALVTERAAELFGFDRAESAEQRVASTWSVSLDRLRAEAPLAGELLNLCAFLSPDDIPRTLPTEHPQTLPRGLAEAARNPVTFNRLVVALGRYSLVLVSPTALEVHRLVQAVVRSRLGEYEERHWAEVAVRLLHAGFPVDSDDVRRWSACERLLPHSLAAAGHGDRLGVEPQATGWLLNRAATYLQGRAQLADAKVLFERALAIHEAALGPDHPEVARDHNNLGGVLRALGDVAAARAQYEQALTIGETALGLSHPDVATFHGGMGGVLRVLGDLDGAKEQLERALAIHEAALGPDHPDVGRDHNGLGNVLRDRGDLKGARGHFERALAISKAIFGPDHPRVAIIRGNLGSVLHDVGDFAGAQDQLQRALTIYKTHVGSDHPDMAIIHNNLGGVLQTLGNLAGARDHSERALKIREAAFGSNHPDVGRDHDKLGGVLRDLGDLDGARAQVERALEILEAALGGDHPDVATSSSNLGTVLRDLGDLEGARVQFERALEIGEAALGPDHPTMAIRRNNLGSVLRDLGDLEGAKEQFERALAIGEAALGPDHPTLAIWRNNLGLVLQALKETSPEGSPTGL